MRLLTPILALALGGLLAGATLLAQDHAAPAGPQAAPEHALLKTLAGKWDADFKSDFGNHKATMTWRMLGDFWLIGDYAGEMMGAPFNGHTMLGWDAEAKEYTGTWCDSTSPSMVTMHGRYDAPGKTLTLASLEMNPMTGKKVNVTHKYVWGVDGAVTYTFTMEGTPAPMMTITYTKAK